MADLTLADAPTDRANQAGLPGVSAPSNPYFKPQRPIQDQSILSDETERDQTNVEEGEIVITWPKALSEESFADFEYWVHGLIRRARRKAGLPPEKQPTKQS